MLKICYLGIADLGWNKDIANYFADQGHEVYLITFNKPRVSYSSKVRIIRLKNTFGILGYLLHVPSIKRIINKINPDLLHVNWAAGYGLTSRLLNFHPLVISCIGGDVLFEEQKAVRGPLRYLLVKLLIKTILKNADYLLPISGEVKEKIVSYGLTTDRMQVFFVEPLIKDVIGRRDEAMIISNRKLTRLYQVDVFLKAAALVKEEFPNIKIVVAGEGDRKGEYIRLADELGLKGRIEFTGWLAEREIYERTSRAGVFISTCPSDGTPASVLEAMELKTPVVAVDNQANREWIKDGFNGYLFSAGDHKAAAGRILDLLRDKDKRRLFSERSYEIVKEKGDFNKNIIRLEDLYRSLAVKKD